jgi:uncharacterized protein involved in exopolysaccharide biosynthesis
MGDRTEYMREYMARKREADRGGAPARTDWRNARIEQLEKHVASLEAMSVASTRRHTETPSGAGQSTPARTLRPVTKTLDEAKQDRR